MLDNLDIKGKVDAAQTWLNEQVWFQQIKEKWEEIDFETRGIIKIVAGVVAVGFVLLFLTSTYFSVSGLKTLLVQKNEAIAKLKSAKDELAQLEAITGGRDVADQDWTQYFRSAATQAQLQPESISVQPGRKATSGSLAEEAMFEIKANRINIRQATYLAFHLENDGPVKLRSMTVQTDGAEGHLNVVYQVSAFSPKSAEKDGK